MQLGSLFVSCLVALYVEACFRFFFSGWVEQSVTYHHERLHMKKLSFLQTKKKYKKHWSVFSLGFWGIYLSEQ